MPDKASVPLRHYAELLRHYLLPYWRQAALLGLLLAGSIALQLINPQVLRNFIDAAQAAAPMQTLLRTALIFFTLAVIQQALSVASTYFSENLGWATTNDLRNDLAAHCLRLDLSFHNAHTPGELIERIDGDITTLANFFSRFIISIAGNSLLMLGILALLFREDWRIGTAMAVFALLALLVLIRFRNIAVPHWTAERQSKADLLGFLEERLAGTEDIRANGARAYVLRRFYTLMRELLRKSLRAGLMVNVLLNTMLVLFVLGNTVAFLVSALLFQEGNITIGTVYLVFNYANLLQRPINEITHMMGDLQRAGAGLVRVRELFSTPNHITEPSQPAVERIPAGPLAVTFDHVTFRYRDLSMPGAPAAETAPQPTQPAEPTVLQDLSFHLEAGSTLGLLGRTGSGKTSLARLLFRLYDPEQGAVCLGAPHTRPFDLRQLPLAELRKSVGMVTQNIQLFNASVRDNLTFFDPSIPDTQIEQVLHDLGLGDWLDSLPEGLDTELESGGGGLSAGQAQLLAFVRIFLRDPGLIILDEASSRLDPATESLLERAVTRLVRGRTAIIIAHRLHTIQRADQIMILDAGRIQEYGGRTQLASDPASQFARLLETGLEEVLA